MRVIGTAASIAVLMVSGLSATPITINFGGLSAAGAGAVVAGDGNSYTQNGFTFTNTGAPHLLQAWGTLNANHPVGGDPATSLLAYFDTTQIAISAADESPFSIFGIDLAGWGFNQPALASFGVTFTGNIVGGGIVTQTFTVQNFAGSPHLQSFTFSGFTNLSSVSVEQGYFFDGDAFQFNNVIVDAAAPEPSTLALLFGGSLLAAATRFRKTA